MASYPDLPTTETIQAQGPSQQAVVGTAYSAVEYIEVVQRLPMGPQGPVGPSGPQGKPGAKWHTGVGDPNTNGTLATGPLDMYVEDVTGDIWAWNGFQWINTGTDILGPTGPQGIQGFTGDTGPIGPMGPQGAGVKILGSYGGSGSTPPPISGSEQPGDGWVDAVGNLWTWVENPAPAHYENVGKIHGPTGPAGVMQSFTTNFAFSANNPNTPAVVYQTVVHTLSNPWPVVRCLIDFDGTGVFTADQSVNVSYHGPTTVKLAAEASIAIYNGARGKVVLQ